MTKYFLLGGGLLILSVIFGCKNTNTTNPQNEILSSTVDTVLQNYDNGQISRKYVRIGGKIEGEMKDFHRTGELKGIRYFENDKQIGKTTVFFPSGAVKEVQYYENGLRQKADTMFFESGAIQYITEFKDDKRNGAFKSWNEDGSMIFEMMYKDDALVQEGK